MTPTKLRDLRHNYKAAYTEYMNCVHTVSIASLNDTPLTDEERLAEERAFHALAQARLLLLDHLGQLLGAAKKVV